jgi:hypothetical protein
LEFEHYIRAQSIEDSENVLIQIFTSLNNEKAIATLLHEITILFPNAHIIGSTTDGEICDDKVTTDTTVISITVFEKTKLHSTLIHHHKNSHTMGQEIAKELIHEDTKLIITFTDGLTCNGEEYLNGISSINNSVIVAGGMAGDDAKFEATYVFTKDQIVSNGAVGISLSNQELQIHTDYSFNWLTIGKDMVITHAEKTGFIQLMVFLHTTFTKNI